MDYVIYYESAAAVILLVIAISYRYKTWVMLRRNQCFYSILTTMLVIIAVDIAGRIISPHVGEHMRFCAMIFATFSNMGTLILCMEVSEYYLGMVRCREKAYLVLKNFLELLVVLLVVAFLTNGQTHLLFWYDESLAYHTGYGMYPVLAVSELFVLLGSAIVLKRHRNFHKTHQWIIMLGAALLIMAALPLQYFYPRKFRLIFYVFAVVTITYYLVFHLSAQYMRRRRGIFSRVGLRQYIEESEKYQRDFYGVAINIINMYSILSVCSEEEMRIFDAMIGKELQSLSSKCLIYQSNESEYILLSKEEKMMEMNCHALQKGMPAVMRINGKNVSLNYGYYVFSFAEASYSEGNLYRIAAGLRRVAANIGDSDKVLRYQGKIKEELQKEMQGLQTINEVLETGNAGFDLRFMPIYSARNGEIKELEVFAYLALEEGTYLTEEEIWKLSAERGNDKAIALALWTEIADLAQKQRIFEQGIRLLHINVSPKQISSKETIDKLCEILKDRELKPEQIVLEVFADQSVPEEILRENTQYMRELKFHVLLDQFGINICNLKNILAMPFDQAKLNMQMMERLIQDKQQELWHLVNMLRNQNWEIYADGADSLDHREEVSELGIDGIQGRGIAAWIPAEQLMDWLQQKGGQQL